jgi:hypothetical protein
MVFVWSIIEKSGAQVLKTALKATLAPILKNMILESKSKVRSESRSGQTYLGTITKLTGIPLANFDAFNKAVAAAEASSGAIFDQSIDAAVDVLLAGMKGAVLSEVLIHVCCSLKTALFGDLCIKFYEFCRGFMENPNIGWTSLVTFVSEQFSFVASWLGFDALGLVAKSSTFLVGLRGYLNPSLTQTETVQMALNAIGGVSSYFGAPAQVLANSCTYFRAFLEWVKPAAVLQDAKRIYLPTLQYAYAQITMFIPMNGEFPRFGDIDVASASFAIVQFFPRACGLLKLTGNLLLFDVKNLVPTWISRTLEEGAAFAPSAVTSSLKQAYNVGTTGISFAQGFLPMQAAIGSSLKAYTVSISGKSACERFANSVGKYIDMASIAILIWQILLDFGTAGYIYKYGQLPPIHFQTKCIKTFTNQDYFDKFTSKALVSDEQKKAILDKSRVAFEEDARRKLSEFEKRRMKL